MSETTPPVFSEEHENKSVAWESGYDACFFGFRQRSDNPYDEETQPDKFQDWEDGWDRADSDCGSVFDEV